MKRFAIVAAAVVIGLASLAVGPVGAAGAATRGYATVKGTILKSSGNPLTATKITVGVGDCETPGGCGADSVVTVMTDDGGHYHARVLVTANPHVYVSVPAKGPYQGRASAYITIASGKTYTKNLTVQKQTMFVGTVVESDGSPRTAVLKVYSAKNNSFQTSDATKSSEGGYFHLPLPEGAYKVKVLVNEVVDGKKEVDTTWYGSKTKDSATIVRITSGEDQRANIVVIP